MNTMACIAAMVASLWLAAWLFGDINEPALGFIAIIAFIMAFLFALLGLQSDLSMVQGMFNRNNDPRRRGRRR